MFGDAGGKGFIQQERIIEKELGSLLFFPLLYIAQAGRTEM
jgi:hypothetical protein